MIRSNGREEAVSSIAFILLSFGANNLDHTNPHVRAAKVYAGSNNMKAALQAIHLAFEEVDPKDKKKLEEGLKFIKDFVSKL